MSELVENPTLTQKQLQGALALAQLQPGERSPFRELLTQDIRLLNTQDWEALRRVGWLEPDDSPQLTSVAADALRAFCHPKVTASLLMGTPDSLFTTQMYSAGKFEDGALASFLADLEADEFGFALQQSPSTLAEALSAQLLVGALDQSVTFQAELGPEAFVVLLAAADWRLQNTLQALLDRSPAPEPSFRVSAIWQALVEGRMSENLNWLITVFTYLLPFLNYELDQNAFAAALPDLEAQELIQASDEGHTTMLDPLLELADALQPIHSFAALSVEVESEGGHLSSQHLAFLRGREATLLVQPVTDHNGQAKLMIDSLDGVELGELIYTLGKPAQELVGVAYEPAPEPELEPKTTAPEISPSDATIIQPPSINWQVTLPDNNQSYPLEGPLQIGREQSNQIQLLDGQASRQHARIEPAGANRFQVVDLGSSNGTFVNEQRISQPTILQGGDVIRIGKTQLIIQTEDQPSPSPESAAPATQTCTSCGAQVSVERKFCPSCGAPLMAPPPAGRQA